MALRYVFLLVVVSSICHSYCNADTEEEALLSLLLKALKSNANNSPSDNPRKQCTALCHECYKPAAHPVTEMGCFEKCMVDGPANFECPGRQAFLDVLPTVSPELEDEIKDFFAERSRLFSERDLDGIEGLFTEDCAHIFDKQIPVIGRHDIMTKIRDYFDASPELGFQDHTVDTFGVDDDGVIWVNGHLTDFDKQDQKISNSINFMSLLKRAEGNGTLQEFTLVFFE